MALGIDIYRYQTVTDWNAVKRHGVSFVYVKGTDGGKPAIVRADNQVRGAKSVGIPVGLYHYAQLSPSPEEQADILTGEVRRLGALGLPPALDLEDPHRPGPLARDFAFRFLTRLRSNGFDAVTLYGNTSMLNGISAATLGVPNTVVWLAAYGPNDGKRHPHSYRGKVNIHQYTSVGAVPGISGQVDLNELLTPLGDNEVALKDEKIKFWQDAGNPFGGLPGDKFVPADEVLGWIHNYSQGAWRDSAETKGIARATLAAVTGDEVTNETIRVMFAEELEKAKQLDMNAIRATVREALGEDNEDQADVIVDKIGQRLFVPQDQNGA